MSTSWPPHDNGGNHPQYMEHGYEGHAGRPRKRSRWKLALVAVVALILMRTCAADLQSSMKHDRKPEPLPTVTVTQTVTPAPQETVKDEAEEASPGEPSASATTAEGDSNAQAAGREARRVAEELKTAGGEFVKGFSEN